MKGITKITYLLLGPMLSAPLAAQKTHYMDPEGSDSNPGTSGKPFVTLVKAQEVVAVGDVVYTNPGTYVVSINQVPMTTTNSGFYHCVFYMNKSGEAGRPISYLANSNKQGRLIFDLLQVKPKDQRITVFYVTGSNLHLKGLDVIGTQVAITGHTQSECFCIVKGADNNKFEDLRMHDGTTIGLCLLGGSDNHTLNYDAYNNYDSVSEGGKGGNIDGLDGHISPPSVGEDKGTGSVSEGCYARYNSDDGFGLINCFEAAKIINCQSFLSRYKPGTREVASDGTGSKAGSRGMAADKLPAIPSVILQREVRNSSAYHNRLRGLYANHHLGEIIFESNTAANSEENYNMTNRESSLTLPPTDANGYDHMVKNNLPLVTRSGSKHTVMVNRAESKVSNNLFDGSEEVMETDFISLEEAELMKDRKPNGDSPDANFGKLITGAGLRFWGMGCFATGEPTDLDLGWLKRPTIVVVGGKASVVGPEAASFTKMYVIVDGEETTESDKNSVDLFDFSGAPEVETVIEDANGNIIKSIALRFKR